jgi:hypothetical protein
MKRASISNETSLRRCSSTIASAKLGARQESQQVVPGLEFLVKLSAEEKTALIAFLRSL